MALQELDIEIFYRPGKVNSNADALSRSPLQEVGAEEITYGIVSAVTVEENTTVPTDDNLALLQKGDPHLASVITYLESTRR